MPEPEFQIDAVPTQTGECGRKIRAAGMPLSSGTNKRIWSAYCSGIVPYVMGTRTQHGDHATRPHYKPVGMGPSKCDKSLFVCAMQFTALDHEELR